MNYITEIKAFHDLVQVKQLSTGQIALWYALMYLNNKCAWVEWFTVPNLTLELHSGLSRQGIAKTRNVLKQHGLIDFKSNGTKATSYKLCTMLNGLQVSLQDGLQVSLQDGVQDSLQDGVQDSSTLNKLNKTKQNNKKNNKKKYGEFNNILLTDDEKDRLVSELGQSLFDAVITFYSAYKAEKNPKTKSDNLTIRRWVIGAVKEKTTERSIKQLD